MWRFLLAVRDLAINGRIHLIDNGFAWLAVLNTCWLIAEKPFCRFLSVNDAGSACWSIGVRLSFWPWNSALSGRHNRHFVLWQIYHFVVLTKDDQLKPFMVYRSLLFRWGYLLSAWICFEPERVDWSFIPFGHWRFSTIGQKGTTHPTVSLSQADRAVSWPNSADEPIYTRCKQQPD